MSMPGKTTRLRSDTGPKIRSWFVYLTLDSTNTIQWSISWQSGKNLEPIVGPRIHGCAAVFSPDTADDCRKDAWHDHQVKIRYLGQDSTAAQVRFSLTGDDSRKDIRGESYGH